MIYGQAAMFSSKATINGFLKIFRIEQPHETFKVIVQLLVNTLFIAHYFSIFILPCIQRPSLKYNANLKYRYLIFSLGKKQYFSFLLSHSLKKVNITFIFFFALELYLSVALLRCNSLNDA